MIEYRLKEQGIDIVDTVLTNRKLDLSIVDKILCANKDNEELGTNYKNMDKAVQRYKKALKEGETIATLVDEDLDGNTSSALLYNFTYNDINYKNIHYIHQKKAKVHGLNEYVINKVKKLGVNLLITPDSSSSDYKYQKELAEMGVDLIVLDHHQFDIADVFESTILVNNQDGNVQNTSLSGCGVTYKFVKEVALDLGIDLGEKYLDLVALSLIGDVMDMTSLENRYYLNVGSKLENITNPFLKYFVEKNKIERYLTIEELGFSISPLINATVRMGSKSDKDIVFRSLLDRKELVESKKRGVEKGTLVPVEEEGLRIATNTKSKQDKARNKAHDEIVNTFGRDIKDKVFIQEVGDMVESEIGGLVANKLTDTYQRPIILIRYNEQLGYCTGSARSISGVKGVEDFKTLCKETGDFIFAQGHANSFGLAIDKDKVNSVREKLNSKLEGIEFSTICEVDGEYENAVPLSHVKAIGKYEDLWCNNIKAPLFVVKGIKLDTEEIEKIGNATYTFKVGDVKFTKNFGSKIWYESILQLDDLPFGGRIVADVIVKFRRNKKGYYWCDIVDMVTRVDEELEIDF